MKDVTPIWKAARRTCKIKNEYVLSALGEFWGTFVLALFAVGAGCQTTLLFNFPVTLIGEIFGLLIAITIFGGASGAHLNPAVTLGLAVSGKIGWTKVPLYWFMQFLGAYLGAGLAYGLYMDKVESFVNVGMFASFPRNNVGIAFADQVVGTAIFVMIVHAALDERNMRVPKYFYGPVVALTFTGINFAFLLNAGGLLNPARDMAGRLMAITVGVESDLVFDYKNPGSGESEPYWLAPFFGPLVGGIIGALLYILFVGAHLELGSSVDENDDSEDSNENNKYYQGQGPSGQRPDWRNTEFVPRFGAPGHSPPPNKYGSPLPQAAEKDKKKKKGGFGIGLRDFNQLQDVASGGMEAAQNFQNFDHNNMGLEDLQNMKDAANTAMDARELAQKGYDAYQQNYGGQQQMNRRSGGNMGYAGSPPPPPMSRFGPPSRQDFGRRSGNYY